MTDIDFLFICLVTIPPLPKKKQNMIEKVVETFEDYFDFSFTTKHKQHYKHRPSLRGTLTSFSMMLQK